jgi:hypothetical protein
MLQDQKTQMTHSNNTIIEEVSEQQLHAITGGCSDCQVVARAAALQIKRHAEEAGNATSTSDAFYAAKKVIGFENLSKEASKTVGTPVQAGEKRCQHCEQHYNELKSLLLGRPYHVSFCAQ